MEQKILRANGEYSVLDSWFRQAGCVMLVCGKSIQKQKINSYLEELPSRLGIRLIRFSEYSPNPDYESVRKGVSLFRKEQCGSIVAVGGGSAMDVAKCIKLYSNMSGDGRDGAFLNQTIIPNDIPFLAMPTTSGTGSEATRFAVIYYKGVKQSVSDESCIPLTVLLDSSVLKTLPGYQKKATMMDALCHAVESFWSVNSTEQSRTYSRQAIEQILAHMDPYLSNEDKGNEGMLLAANTAGKAINLTQTTAGHAMCYKITSLFGCAHGHAAILCDRILFSWMIENMDRCVDPRGEEYLNNLFHEIALALGVDSPEQAADKLNRIFDQLELDVPEASAEQYEELKTSVNPVRLKNHPVALDLDTIDALYHEILR